MNLVQKQHLPLSQIGQNGGQIALDLQGWPGGLLKANVQLIGDDGRERSFAQAWGPKQEHMVQSLAA